jgi:hypothetical protein
MPANRCPEYVKLESEVESVLQKLTEITSAQLAAFQENDPVRVFRLDKELELTIGEKERALGALRQHVKEHGCQSARGELREVS